MRKTKIICTLGPSSESEETLRRLMIEGMDVARFNFSHGTHEEQLEKFNLVKRIREENEMEVENLRQKAIEQERQLNDINSRASQLTQRQSELAQDLINQQQKVAIPQFDESLLVDSLDSISNEITEDSADKIKSWIEESSNKEG